MLTGRPALEARGRNRAEEGVSALRARMCAHKGRQGGAIQTPDCQEPRVVQFCFASAMGLMTRLCRRLPVCNTEWAAAHEVAVGAAAIGEPTECTGQRAAEAVVVQVEPA